MESDKNLGAVAENMSPVNPDVTEAAQAETVVLPGEPVQASPVDTVVVPKKKRLKPVRGMTDRKGRDFDPALHEVDSSGNPRINARDGYISIKPGRHGHGKNNRSVVDGSDDFKRGGVHSGNVSRGASASDDVRSDNDEVQRLNAARVSAAVFVNTGVVVFGNEWLPKVENGVDENLNLVKAFDDYYRVKGVADIPPGAALVLALLGYGASRLQLPQTRSRFEVILNGVKVGAFKFARGAFEFFKKIGVRKNGSHVNTRDDGKRENDTGAGKNSTLVQS